MKFYKSKYGFFTDDGSEYVITNAHTPKPWVNVISNGKYGLVISQTGGGFSWDTHSEFNRLNRWHQDLILDNWGKFFYFKNEKTGDLWSPTWMPVKQKLDFYECRFGMGYSTFTSEFKGVKTILNVFVPFDDDLEIWNFSIQNKNDEPIELSITSYFEWCLGSSADHHREFHKTFLETEFDFELNTLTAQKRLWDISIGERGHWNTEYPNYGFISSTNKIKEFQGDKESFIGKNGSVERPNEIFKKSLSGKTGKWNDSIGTVKIKLKIKPNETEETAFLIGIKPTTEEIKTSIEKYNVPSKIKTALENVKQRWIEILDPLEIKTPDNAMNFLVNKWLRYQAISGRLWGRTAYYQQSGAFGFRDQLQDSLVFLPIDPKMTEKQIRLHARHQFEDGTVLHWWHPITETGLTTQMTDDLLWLPYIIFHYIDETANLDILNQKEPYYDNKEKYDTLFDHCIAAIEKVLTRYSDRGLPLIGAGDWNDGLSAVGLDMKGESIWLAEFFYLILIRFADICQKIDENSKADKYLNKAAELKSAFDKYAWNGSWFFRATKDDGSKIGSEECKEGKIFLNTQTWGVISGIADSDRQKKSMASAAKYLLRENGALLLAPAYSSPDKYIGYLCRYAPGKRENGGVYSHAAAWAVWGFAKIRDKENAFKAYKNLCPIDNYMKSADKYCAEPYVMPGNIDGPDSPDYGMGGWTWYTGSASWYQNIFIEWILGIRPTFEGLLIDPLFPENWKGFSIKRTFRGKTFYINVTNESGKAEKVLRIIVNGKKIKGKLIQLIPEIDHYEVEVYL